MKTIAKLLPMVSLLIISLLSIAFLEFKGSSDYLNFKGYQKDFITIKHHDGMEMNGAVLDQMISLAHKHNVILAKRNISNQNSKVKDVYISFDSVEELKSFLEKHFNIKYQNKDMVASSFISTYNHYDQNQIGLIPDLLENTYYNYYTFDVLKENHGNLYESYIVYYKNRNDYEQYKNEIVKLTGYEDIGSFSMIEISNTVFIIMAFSIFILMLFYFIFQIYDAYYQAKKIGCMKLMGFDNKKISQKLIQKKFRLYIIFIFVLLTLIVLFVKNISFFHILFLIICNGIVLMITYWTHYISVKSIVGKYQLSNILKKENLAFRISKINGKLKVAVIILLIGSISMLLYSFTSMAYSLTSYKNAKKLLNYGALFYVSGMPKEQYEYEKHIDLFKRLATDSNLETFYVNFSRYSDAITMEEQAGIDEKMEKGILYKQVEVDQNYLKKEKIDVYDRKKQKVNIENIDRWFYLFPMSKESMISSFEQYYNSEKKKQFESYQMEKEFLVYLYDDRLLDSYDIENNNFKVKSPIIQVIDKHFKISYMESMDGVDIFGSGLSTGLKIKNSTSHTIDQVMNHVEQAGLSNYIKKDSFVSYYDYFQDEIQNAKMIILITTFVIVIMIMIYTIISVQVISLYMKSEQQTVMVKYLLGFEQNDIFGPIFKKNQCYNLIACILCILIFCLLGQIHLFLILFAMILFIMIDCVIMFCLTKSHRFSKVYINLKGGNYD